MTSADVRRIVLSRAMLAVGLIAALTGAALATGIMAYGAIADGTTYTTLSWALIAPGWVFLALLWLLVRRWPLAAAASMGWLAIFAGIYYDDVYGQFPAGLLFLLGTAVVFTRDWANEDRARTPTEMAVRAPKRKAE